MDPTDAIIAANSPERAEHLLVLDAPGLAEQARARADRVSVWCDDIRDSVGVEAELLIAHPGTAPLDDVDLVWLRLPPALGALDEYAELVAARASKDVQLVAGGREKHLNRSMNQTLASHFGQVAASLGARKARALLASEPASGSEPSWPRSRQLIVQPGDRPLELWWHGATFAAGRVDAGTQLLIDHLDQIADADRYLDLGCGSGLLATLIALERADAEVHAVDASWAAVDATARTAVANNTDVQTHWAADLADFDASSLDVIVCNPPFHRGTAKDSDPAFGMFAEAARTLGDGGEFWCVYNSHLPWKSVLSRTIGPTRLVAQNRHYSLTRSVRRGV